MNNFEKVQNWLNKLASEAKFFRKGKAPTLEVVNKILDELERPDEYFKWRVVVGGTAGKGTVCALVENVLEGQGIRTACLMSPHIQVVTERIRIGGQLISKEDFEENILEIKKIAKKLKIPPTYYEAIVLAGILAAQKAKAEVLICEVGMGGRLDAVNAVRGKRVSALTFVGNDHLEFFENKIEKLAAEKAGIFTKDSVLNLSFEQKYYSILKDQAHSDIEFMKGVKSKLCKKIARRICEKVLGKNDFMMAKAQLPARWEKLKSPPVKGNTIILDGAHSQDRFEFILPKLKKITGKKIGIFAMAKNHDPESFKIILPYFDEVIWTEVSGEREFWPASYLQEKLKTGTMEKNPIKAFELVQKSGGKIFVMGSFYLCGKIRELFYSSEEILNQRMELFF